jgi:organic hydroperoxide reductase OsmC/OhrA/uncharacterized protein YjiS (DUF1127 family)
MFQCSFLHRFIALLQTWRQQLRDRKVLAEMDDRSLRDIGLTRYDVEVEVRKPCWRAWTLHRADIEAIEAKEERMADRTHRYEARLTWTGGTASLPFRNHDRSYQLDAPGKPAILGSSDKLFRGDAQRWNPEDLLVASLSACHHLWYLGLCAAAGIVVLAYEDAAEGEMVEQSAGGAGQFVRVTLRPHITLAVGSDRDKALALHETAHKNCFIARSVNFPVEHVPVVVEAPRGGQRRQIRPRPGLHDGP